MAVKLGFLTLREHGVENSKDCDSIVTVFGMSPLLYIAATKANIPLERVTLAKQARCPLDASLYHHCT